MSAWVLPVPSRYASSPCAVIRTTRIPGTRSLIRRAVSMPPARGRSRSIRITSGSSSCAWEMAVSSSWASPTTRTTSWIRVWRLAANRLSVSAIRAVLMSSPSVLLGGAGVSTRRSTRSLSSAGTRRQSGGAEKCPRGNPQPRDTLPLVPFASPGIAASPVDGADRAAGGSVRSSRWMQYRRLTHRYAVGTTRIAAWSFTSQRSDVRGLGFGRPRWRPDADVCETADSIDVVVDLAGVDEDAIEVQLFDDALVVEGERHLPTCGPESLYHAAGVLQGPFRLELPLPMPVDPSGVDARYERGLLRIRMRKQGAGR